MDFCWLCLKILCVFFEKMGWVLVGKKKKKLYKANKNTKLWEEWFKKNCFLSTHSDGLKNTFGGRGGDTEHPFTNLMVVSVG